MKVLSLTQPWATLVVIGAKKFETRSWKTGYRGELLIHASKEFPKHCRELCAEKPFMEALKFRSWTILPTGTIIGKVKLVDCISTSAANPARVGKEELSFGDWNIGRYAWELRNPEEFAEPIPAKGSLGLWEYQP